jgi:outer membrane lipoprotein-sorting protein
MIRIQKLGALLLVMCGMTAGTVAAEGEAKTVLASWFAAQTNLHTWEADFVQTRFLKTLTQPLTATGHVWFAVPNRFRWELRGPQPALAVRASDEMLVIYEKLKRVERFPLSGQKGGQWREALSLLEVGFPRNEAEMRAQYDLLSQSVSNSLCELSLQPRSTAARRMIPRIRIAFSTDDLSLRMTELEFPDGSRMRNDFNASALNPKIDEKQFAPEIPDDFKVVEPLSQKGSAPPGRGRTK